MVAPKELMNTEKPNQKTKGMIYMRFPKIKNALLCRLTVYAVVLGTTSLLILAVALMDFIPPEVRVILGFAILVGLVIYIIKNFMVLMSLDLFFATAHCMFKARTQYNLPEAYTFERAKTRVSRYGKRSKPADCKLAPEELTYRFCRSFSNYEKGNESVVAMYQTDYLDGETYRQICSSAKANSRLLTGKKNPRVLDANANKLPVSRVTVVIISAKQIDAGLFSALYDKVCKQIGDETHNAFMPCIIDESRRICFFDGMSIPNVGFGTGIKNKGIKIIRKCVFGGKIDVSENEHYVSANENDTDETLWTVWREFKKGDQSEDKKILKEMESRQIKFEDYTLYIKWDERGVSSFVEFDEENRVAKIVWEFDFWDYPKSTPISKEIRAELEQMTADYFSKLGYDTEFSEIKLDD